MIKREELTKPNSCLNKARDDEMLFVLLERDDTFADTVRYWIQRRIEKGKNKPDDAQLVEAEACAAQVENVKKFLAAV